MRFPAALPKVMLLIETSREYGRKVVEGIGSYVATCGPWSIDFHERGLEDPLPAWLEKWQGDGIISRTVRRADIDRLLATGLPVVELFADPALGLPRVYSNAQSISALAVEHFAERGLKQVAYFATRPGWWNETRREAFLEFAARQGLSGSVFNPKPSPRRGRRSLEREIADWLGALPKPCGVFCAMDGFALELMNVCREVGIAIPEQIAVLGVDNDLVISSITNPPLSSISLNARRIGYEAAALLDRMMNGQPPPQEGVVVEPEGVVSRQSTDILMVSDPDVARALGIIRERAGRGLQVTELAAAVALSRRALEKRFQQAIQRTPKEEILRVQIERAKQFLRQTSLSVEQVAHRSGFRSFKYFARAFRREARVTPRAYRQTHRVPSIG